MRLSCIKLIHNKLSSRRFNLVLLPAVESKSRGEKLNEKRLKLKNHKNKFTFDLHNEHPELLVFTRDEFFFSFSSSTVFLQRSLIKALVHFMKSCGIFRQKIYVFFILDFKCKFLVFFFLRFSFVCSCDIAKLHHLLSDSIPHKFKSFQIKSRWNKIFWLNWESLKSNWNRVCDIVSMNKYLDEWIVKE